MQQRKRRHTRIARLFSVLSLVMLVGGVIAAAVLPGPQHMLCLACHGFERIGPFTYVEETTPEAERQRLLGALRAGRNRTRAFFGPLRSKPQIVYCRSRGCAELFGSAGARGIAYGWHAILLTPSRLLDVIAAHEYVHVELHWRMGIRGWLRGAVPAWFDEGLATHISGDPRYMMDYSREAVRDVMQVTSYLGEWRRHAKSVGWRQAYGAAATRVRQLERRIGRRGLRRFVAELVEGSGDFGALLDTFNGRMRRP